MESSRYFSAAVSSSLSLSLRILRASSRSGRSGPSCSDHPSPVHHHHLSRRLDELCGLYASEAGAQPLDELLCERVYEAVDRREGRGVPAPLPLQVLGDGSLSDVEGGRGLLGPEALLDEPLREPGTDHRDEPLLAPEVRRCAGGTRPRESEALNPLCRGPRHRTDRR